MPEYTGTNCYIKFGSTVLSTDYRSLDVEEEMGMVDGSAGNQKMRSYLNVMKDGTASLELVDQTGGTVLWAAVKVGTEGTLEWGPEGTATGKPKNTVNAKVKNRKRTFPYDDIVVMTIDFQFSAPDSTTDGVTEGTY